MITPASSSTFVGGRRKQEHERCTAQIEQLSGAFQISVGRVGSTKIHGAICRKWAPAVLNCGKLLTSDLGQAEKFLCDWPFRVVGRNIQLFALSLSPREMARARTAREAACDSVEVRRVPAVSPGVSPSLPAEKPWIRGLCLAHQLDALQGLAASPLRELGGKRGTAFRFVEAP